jgi:hypothetical protein
LVGNLFFAMIRTSIISVCNRFGYLFSRRQTQNK